MTEVEHFETLARARGASAFSDKETRWDFAELVAR
jgi:hypothetical protein